MTDMGIPAARSAKKRDKSSEKYLALCLHAETHRPQAMHLLRSILTLMLPASS